MFLPCFIHAFWKTCVTRFTRLPCFKRTFIMRLKKTHVLRMLHSFLCRRTLLLQGKPVFCKSILLYKQSSGNPDLYKFHCMYAIVVWYCSCSCRMSCYQFLCKIIVFQEMECLWKNIKYQHASIIKFIVNLTKTSPETEFKFDTMNSSFFYKNGDFTCLARDAFVAT